MRKEQLMKHLINIDDVTGENTQNHDPRRPQISDHPHNTLLNGGSRSGTNAQLKQMHCSI